MVDKVDRLMLWDDASEHDFAKADAGGSKSPVSATALSHDKVDIDFELKHGNFTSKFFRSTDFFYYR